MNTENTTDGWYCVDDIVQALINKTPRGNQFADAFKELCIGYQQVRYDYLAHEISCFRERWRYAFPLHMKTEEIMELIDEQC